MKRIAFSLLGLAMAWPAMAQVSNEVQLRFQLGQALQAEAQAEARLAVADEARQKAEKAAKDCADKKPTPTPMPAIHGK